MERKKSEQSISKLFNELEKSSVSWKFTTLAGRPVIGVDSSGLPQEESGLDEVPPL